MECSGKWMLVMFKNLKIGAKMGMGFGEGRKEGKEEEEERGKRVREGGSL